MSVIKCVVIGFCFIILLIFGVNEAFLQPVRVKAEQVIQEVKEVKEEVPEQFLTFQQPRRAPANLVHYEIVCIDKIQYIVTESGSISPHVNKNGTHNQFYTCN